MLTLEQPRKTVQKLTRGTKLYCYNGLYDFIKGFKYQVFSIEDGEIIVKDNNGIQVLFDVAEFKEIFKIIL